MQNLFLACFGRNSVSQEWTKKARRSWGIGHLWNCSLYGTSRDCKCWAGANENIKYSGSYLLAGRMGVVTRTGFWIAWIANPSLSASIFFHSQQCFSGMARHIPDAIPHSGQFIRSGSLMPSRDHSQDSERWTRDRPYSAGAGASMSRLVLLGISVHDVTNTSAVPGRSPQAQFSVSGQLLTTDPCQFETQPVSRFARAVAATR
jgi:hypothetical protein